jgi:uncharacterized protein YndB with AHSA1/START domain
MPRLNFKININAPRKKVWDTMLEDKTYREWTTAFHPGSHAETDWQTGSKTLFLDSDGNGMVSTIAENRPQEYISIKHLGIVKNGVEDTESPEVKEWAGAMENYTFKDSGGGTELAVEMDSNDQYKEFLEVTWPEALKKLKGLAEK